MHKKDKLVSNKQMEIYFIISIIYMIVWMINTYSKDSFYDIVNLIIILLLYLPEIVIIIIENIIYMLKIENIKIIKILVLVFCNIFMILLGLIIWLFSVINVMFKIEYMYEMVFSTVGL